MFLKHISLQNFKCLEDIQLSFTNDEDHIRKWTLILGENGTGKSNFLKAVALVTAGSNAIGQLLGDANSWIRNGADSCTINAILETKKGEERKITLRINKDSNLSEIIHLNNTALNLIDNAIDNAQRNYFVVAYGASRRLSDENSMNLEKESYGRFNNIKNLFFSSYTLNPLASWIIDIDYQSGADGIRLIKGTLNDFLPGTRFNSIDKLKKRVLFETADGIVPLEQLSDGYQNMAAWIGDLLYRVTQTFRDYKKPLEARGLLLIDEIDLHLHPKWQRKLLEFISNKLPNFQVIAATHSPLTAQQADEGELYALKRDAKTCKISIIPFIGSPKSLLVNQLLMTPIFGLETDESLEVEKTKKTYDELKSKEENLTENQQEEFEVVKKKLKQTLPQRDIPVSSDKEIDLLQRIEKQLNIR